MIAGIILAAGESSRLGRCKATLPVGASHLLGLTLDALSGAGLSPLVVVAGRYHSEIEHAASPWQVEVVFNKEWPQGQITSLQCALSMIGSGSPVVVALVDHPGFSASLVQKMVEAYEASEQHVCVVPRYEGKTGHPVLFGPEMTRQIRTLPTDWTARDLIEAFGNRVLFLDTQEEAIVRDIDTEEEYLEFVRIWENPSPAV